MDSNELSEKLILQSHANISKLESIYSSSWSSSEEIAKTVISVSSGVIAFTIAFSESIIKNMKGNFGRYFVCLSWVLFLLSIITALISLWRTRQARSAAARLLMSASEIQENFSSSEFEKGTNLLKKAITPLDRDNAIYSERFLKASLIFLTIAVLILGSIGIVQFLCF